MLYPSCIWDIASFTFPGGHIMILGGCTGDGRYYLHASWRVFGCMVWGGFFRISQKGLCENVAIPTNSHH